MYTIFGSKGFIGAELVRYFKNKKIKIYAPKRNQIFFKKNLGHVIYCIGSDDWKKFPKKGFQSNLGHLKEIVFNSKFKSFLFLSSSRVYIENRKGETNENSNVKVNTSDPNNYYNLLKLTSESICLNSNKNIKVVRISNVMGKNFNSPLVLPSIIRDAIIKKKINLYINKNSTKDYIHIDDVIDLLIQIIKKGKKNLYNVASGKNITLIKIAKIVQKETNCKIILKNQNFKIYEPTIKIKNIKNEFNFKPKKNIDFEIKKIISDFKIHLNNKVN